MPAPGKPYRIHREAQLDLREAARWYDKQRAGDGTLLVLAVDDAIRLILEAPQRWRRAGQCRKYVLKRYRYSVVYRERDGVIEVVAIAHHKRHPAYWAKR